MAITSNIILKFSMFYLGFLAINEFEMRLSVAVGNPWNNILIAITKSNMGNGVT